MLGDIVTYLRETFEPRAILLHGSRVRGDAAPNSDYDLTLIAPKGFVKPAGFQGALLDLSAEPEDLDILLSHDVPTWPLQILYDDEKGLGAALAERTRVAYFRKPQPLSDDKIMMRKNYLRRMYVRLQERGADPLLRTTYMGEFIERAARYRAEMLREWPQSLHAALKHYEENDPVFYHQLAALAGEDYIKATADAFRTLFHEAIDA